jgi:hypothetical protein
MIVTLSVPEVHKLRNLLYKAHVDTYNKTEELSSAYYWTRVSKGYVCGN